MKVVFDLCAQNTIIRPMAQAICMARGGMPVEYIDTADHKKKVIFMNNLRFLDVKVKEGHSEVNMTAYQVAQEARHETVQVQVNVNDVKVIVDAKTTVEQAMAQFHQKYAQQNCVTHKSPCRPSNKIQHTKD